MKQFQILFLPAFFWFYSSVAQDVELKLSSFEKLGAEKIYLHTDNENYFQGDTIWYKAYITDGRTGQLVKGSENLYVQVSDFSGEPVFRALLLCSDGQAAGRFNLPANTKPGNYLLQAFTNFSLNFNENACFYRQFTVSRLNGSDYSGGISGNTEKMVAGVKFKPEGGILLENITNLVAFKASGHNGSGVKVKGVIKDENGTVASSFSSDYNGMGLFFLTPQTGKHYYAEIDGFSSFKYQFETQKNGIKIQLVNHTAKEVIINVAGNSEDFAGHKFYIINMCRGEVLFYHEFIMDGFNKVLKFDSSTLKQGINRFILADEKFNLLSERLIFSKTDFHENIGVLCDKMVYKKGDEAGILISVDSINGSYEWANLSIAVMHSYSVPPNGFYKNISSNMLIDSELNDFTESSADLFADTEISSEAKLRLLMLTSGGSNYFWNTAPALSDSIRYKKETGVILKGMAMNRMTGQLIKNGEITLAVQKDQEIAFLTRNTNESGVFEFPGILFSDTAVVFVQAKKETGGLNTEIKLDPVFKNAPDPGIRKEMLREKGTHNLEFVNLKYQIANESKKANPKLIKKEDKEPSKSDGRFRLYDSPDFVLEVSAADANSYDNILELMIGKVPGVDISDNSVRIRGTGTFNANSTPLFLIDGIPLAENKTFSFSDDKPGESAGKSENPAESQVINSVKAIPVSDIEKVEILKSARNMSVFGTKGSNGIISIFTRRGEIAATQGLTKGISQNKIEGYQVYNDFYVPVINKGTDSIVSYPNSLIYWNPMMRTTNGKAAIKIPVTSLAGNYRVFIEGISSNGKILTGNADFKVE